MSADDRQIIGLDQHPYTELVTSQPPPLDQHPAAVYLYGLTSDRSRRSMAQALRTIAAVLAGQDARTADILTLDWAAIRYPHAAALRARLLERYSPATVNRTLSALRGVLKEAWRLGQMSAEDYQRAAAVKNVKAQTLPAGRALLMGEILALVEACKADESPAGARDAAIIGLLYTCGLRRAEIAALSCDDFDPSEGRLSVRAGKGRNQRTVYVQGGALNALLDYLSVRPDMPGALFLPVQKNGKMPLRQMSDQGVYDLLKKRANQAGVRDFSPHDLRRTFVSEMLDRGVDIATVADIAGHSSVDTTRRYDRRPEETKKKAAARLHFPY